MIFETPQYYVVCETCNIFVTENRGKYGNDIEKVMESLNHLFKKDKHKIAIFKFFSMGEI